jgi:hypothetical protein
MRSPSGCPRRSLSTLVKRCLHKDWKQRLGDMHDMRLALDGAFETTAPQTSGADVAAAPTAPVLRRRIVTGAIVTLLVGAAVAALATWALMRPAAPRVVQFAITPPPDAPFTVAPGGSNLAISPDAAVVVYQALRGSTFQLYARGIDQLEGRPLAGTEGATNPFFSPDGKQIGFVTRGGRSRGSRWSGGRQRPFVICLGS